MKVIVGLGNPGAEYAKTRHNAGFMAVEKLQDIYACNAFSFEEKLEAEIAKGETEKEKILLAKPQTFMNASGRAVQKILNFYKLDIKDLIVIHDDLDIMLGEMRIAEGRSSAGHKGVQSIIDSLGSKEFTRIRIGIKIEDRKIPTEKFVLSNFQKVEMEKINSIIDDLPLAIEKELDKS